MKSTGSSSAEIIDMATGGRAPTLSADVRAGHNTPPLESQVEVDWGYHARNRLIGNPRWMKRAKSKPSHVDRDLLLYTLWTNGLRRGREITPLTVNLAAYIMCEGRSTAAERIRRLRDDYGLIVKVSEGGSGKTLVKADYSKQEMDAIITSALEAYNRGRDAIASTPKDGHKRDSVHSMGWTKSSDAVDTTMASSIVSTQNSFVSTQEAVASTPRNGRGKGKGKEASKQGGGAKDWVPRTNGVDAELDSAKLAMFGSVERGRLIVERYAKTVGKPAVQVLDQLHYDGGIHGYENVRIAVDSTAGKNPENPQAWYRKVRDGEASKNPGLQPPRQVAQQNSRRLSMAERSF